MSMRPLQVGDRLISFQHKITRDQMIEFESLKKVNPKLIYASLSGYGSTGPKASLPGVNMIALAESGLASTTITEGRAPVPLGYALCDVVASMWAAYGILAAYIHREKTGEGQEVDVAVRSGPVADVQPGRDALLRQGRLGRAQPSQ